MSDDDKIAAHLAALPDGQLISDACARVIASQWCRFQSSALYALSSSGAITGGVFAEVAEEIRYYAGLAEQSALRNAEWRAYEALRALQTYITDKGKRGPVAGWSSLWL